MSHLQNNLASNNHIYPSPIFLDSHNSLNKCYHIVVSYDNKNAIFSLFN